MAKTDKASSVRYAKLSDIGCIRKLNEDSVHCDTNLWLIADGMGGHACGDVASRLAVEVIAREFKQHGEIVKAIEQAHVEVLREGRGNELRQGMGTTIVALADCLDHYQVAWVGDSRAYLFSRQTGKLQQITQDHSLVASLVQQELLSEAQAATHPKRNVITRCLGSKGNKPFSVDHFTQQWQPGDRLLLCSDGLSDELSEDLLLQWISAEQPLATIVQGMIDATKAAGGRDNISAVIIDSPLAF